MKKLLPYILILITLAGIFSPVVKLDAINTNMGLGSCLYSGNLKENITFSECTRIAAPIIPIWTSNDTPTPPTTPPTTTSEQNYNFLAPLPCEIGSAGCDDLGKLSTFDPTGKNKLGEYLNIMLRIFIGICAVLAVIMIVIGGIQYMTSELLNTKEQGRSRMSGAIFGLVLALGAWTLLNTINPDLLKTDLSSLTNVTVNVALYDRGATDPKQANGESVRCTPVPSGPCSVENLTPIFGDKAVAMSKICNMESGGNSVASGTDVCKPGNTPFSFGLFQVNLSANGALAGPDCVGLFNKAVTGSDAIEPKYNSGFNCSLLPGKETLYGACNAKLLDTTTNLAIAKGLFSNSSGINNWVGDKKYCASAFN